MLNIDMWYGDKVEEATRVTVFFNDLSCTYWGNFYKGDKTIGDYTADDSVELEERLKKTFNFSFN